MYYKKKKLSRNEKKIKKIKKSKNRGVSE